MDKKYIPIYGLKYCDDWEDLGLIVLLHVGSIIMMSSILLVVLAMLRKYNYI